MKYQLNLNMMKQIFTSIIVAAIFFGHPQAQEPADPFNWKAPITLNMSDIFLLWSEGADQNSMKSYQKVFKYNIDLAGEPPDERLYVHVKDSSDVTLGGNKKMDVATGNLNGDEIDEVIAIWERSDRMIEVLIPHFDTTQTAWSSSTNQTISGPVITGNSEQGRIFVRTADFDGDEMDEFVVAYLDDDQHIHLEVYDSEGTLVPELKASLADEDLSANSSNQVRFSISTGDFDNSGDDEIVLVGFDNGLFTKVYDVDGSSILPKGRKVIIHKPDFPIYDIDLSVSTLRHYSMDKDIIAVAITYNHNEESLNIEDTHVQLVEVSTNLESFIQDSTRRYSVLKNTNDFRSVLLASGDLNNDDKDELVFAIGNAFDVFTPDANLNLVKQLSGSIPGVGEEGAELEYSYEYLAVADVDQNLGDEIVAVRNIFSTPSSEDENDQYFEIAILGTPHDTLKSLDLVAKIRDEEAPFAWPNRNYALALGNFDASKVTIHEPIYNRVSKIIQPVVILNAPPVHFDVFDSLVYDINNCYEGEPCDFIASYVKSSSQSTEVSTTIQSAWDVTAGVEAKGSKEISAEPAGIGVAVGYEFESHLLFNYGRHFESSNGKSETRSIQEEVNANEDDMIFATITDYDSWEYPYSTGDSKKLSGSIWVLEPDTLTMEGRWFPSKSVSGNTYRPNHEVGNILSYYEYGDLNEHPDIVQNVVSTKAPTTYTLNASTPFSWSLYGEEINHSSTDTTIEFGVDLRLQYGFAVLESNAKGAYVYTHNTTLQQALELKIDLGKIDRSYGPTEYRVTPYAYWSKQGALVVDYSVEPEIGSQVDKTWWQDMYGDFPDPTLILPWRLDPEKGFGINDEAKRQQTKDIVFDPAYPNTGDTVLISTTIRNFSLKDTPGPVKVRFYIGDPDNGGTLLTDIEGQNEFETEGVVYARGLKTIELSWIFPDNLIAYQRIYCVIDPDDSLEEIHEDNNTGWTVIGNPVILSSSESSPEINPVQAEILHQNFPNPFDDASSISYTLSKGETINLHIYNISGKLLKTYNEGYREAGIHSLEIDGNLFESGIYYYAIQGSFGRASRKMVIIH
jgi:hypothetical protein